jgi:iron complex transport system substrate-binding protein
MKKTFTVLLTLFALLTLLTFAACSSAPAPTPTPTPAVGGYPLTITDFLGRSVQIPEKPVRIVATHPTATETLYRVGSTAVGCDSGSKYPSDVQALPKVGSIYSINTEAISALSPDLILIESLTQANLVNSLEQLGVPIVALRAASLDDIAQGLTLVGEIVDAKDAAASAIVDIQDSINAARGNSTGNKTVLILISDAQSNIYAAKPESYPGSVAALINLGNPATGLPDTGPYPGFTLFTGEQALTSNPDIVFTISPAPPPTPRLSAVLLQTPGFNQIPAVKAGHVVELDPMLFLQAQGPRIADAVEEMLRLVNEVSS